MYTFHGILSAIYSDYGIEHFNKKFPYHWLRSSWYHYLNLLDINYSNGYICPKCGVEPSTVICDATSLAFRRAFLSDQEKSDIEENPILSGWYVCFKSTCSHIIINPYSSFQDRVFIADNTCRLLLRKYANTSTNSEVLAKYTESDLESIFFQPPENRFCTCSSRIAPVSRISTL